MDFKKEKELKKLGFKNIVGLDEAGRGPLAGPVVAAAVLVRKIPPANLNLDLMRDSKQLSEKKRLQVYRLLTSNPHIEWRTGRSFHKLIDRINILEATKRAMERAVENLSNHLSSKFNPDFLVIDGNFKINSPLSQESIIKADQKIFSCVAAGIIAKVSRDRAMIRYNRKYPDYGFKQHKGYPTKLHRKRLHQKGPCEIHRRTFGQLKRLK